MPRTTKAPATKTKSSTAKKKASVKKKTTAKKSTNVKAKKASTKKAATKKKAVKATTRPETAQDKIDREHLERLNETGRRTESKAVPVERRKRRRQIDPTTCERDYQDAEIEFMQAMDDYKRQSGRMFPTCSEILEVLSKLGYRKIAESADLMYDPDDDKKNVVEEESLNTRFDDEDDDDE